MAISPDTTARAGGAPSRHHGRPVLGGVSAAVAALGGCEPGRVWALSDAEVAALRALGDLAVSVDAHLVAVLAEAQRRSLGSGDGWGPVGWAHAMAPLVPTGWSSTTRTSGEHTGPWSKDPARSV